MAGSGSTSHAQEAPNRFNGTEGVKTYPKQTLEREALAWAGAVGCEININKFSVAYKSIQFEDAEKLFHTSALFLAPIRA